MDIKTLAISFLAIIATSSCSFADTCPTRLIKEYDGHWVSHQKPGWRSSEVTDHGTKINVKDFGGALYSPKEKRLACVYRSTNGYWVAMVSNIPKKVSVENTKHNHAWHWDKTNKDYTCGRPNVTNPRKCKFRVHS